MRDNVLTAVSVVLALAAPAAAEFADVFEDATLRIDLYHTGDASRETVAIDRLLRQGTWAGPLDELVDPFGYGRYAVRVIDPGSETVLYERGYDSLFGEYRTTAPARDQVAHTFHETVLAPLPRIPVRIEVVRRSSSGDDVVLLARSLDPAVEVIDAEPPAGGAVVVTTRDAGDPHAALDVAVLGEGYRIGDAGLFSRDLARVTDLLLGQEPFASLADRISVRGVLLPSVAAGSDEPTRGRWRDTALGTSFNSLGSPRYLLTGDHRQVRDIAATVPYDTLILMVNHDRYGGGGIYNQYCTFTAHSPFAGYLLLHELGHSFAGLGDEYYTSSVAYEDLLVPGQEPTEPNVTASAIEPKWADLVAPGIELPTPWEKEAFDRMDRAYQKEREALNNAIADAARQGADAERDELEKRLEELSERHAEKVQRFLAASESAGIVGTFEGAGYASTGLYRPQVNCIMFSRGLGPYCEVCAAAVERMIRHYAP